MSEDTKYTSVVKQLYRNKVKEKIKKYYTLELTIGSEKIHINLAEGQQECLLVLIKFIWNKKYIASNRYREYYSTDRKWRRFISVTTRRTDKTIVKGKFIYALSKVFQRWKLRSYLQRFI